MTEGQRSHWQEADDRDVGSCMDQACSRSRVAAVWDSPFDDDSNQPCTVRWMNVACSEDRDNSELRDSLSCGWKFGWIGEVVSPKKTPSGEVLGIVCSLSSFPVQSSHFEFSRTQCHLNGVFHPHFFSSVIALSVLVMVWYGMVWCGNSTECRIAPTGCDLSGEFREGPEMARDRV